MANLRKLSNTFKVVRQFSDITLREGQPSKFKVINGKFTRLPQKVPQATEEVTHTGQYYEEGDWRKNRFIDRSKLVNRNWAIKMIDEIPPIEVEGRVVVCDGRLHPDCRPALGHPKVYINLDKGLPVACMYCGLRFIQKRKR